MKKNGTKERLFEVMSITDKTFKPKLNEEYNEFEKKSDVEYLNDIINGIPGYAKNINTIDSPEYKWYLKVLDFIKNENNNINQKAQLIKFFQNNFLGLDYDDSQNDIDLVKWWISPDQQNFIKDELNIQPPFGKLVVDVDNNEGFFITNENQYNGLLKYGKIEKSDEPYDVFGSLWYEWLEIPHNVAQRI